MSAEKFFTEEQKEVIRKAIEIAEEKTSGEIRVQVTEKCKGDVIAVAEKSFGSLKMHKTKERNGVLFFLAIESRVFAIYGDQGIDSKVEKNFWKDISAEMEQLFKQEKFTEGLAQGIIKAGEALAKYFPHTNDDKNELTNEISFK